MVCELYLSAANGGTSLSTACLYMTGIIAVIVISVLRNFKNNPELKDETKIRIKMYKEMITDCKKGIEERAKKRKDSEKKERNDSIRNGKF